MAANEQGDRLEGTAPALSEALDGLADSYGPSGVTLTAAAMWPGARWPDHRSSDGDHLPTLAGWRVTEGVDPPNAVTECLEVESIGRVATYMAGHHEPWWWEPPLPLKILGWVLVAALAIAGLFTIGILILFLIACGQALLDVVIH